MGIPNNKRKCKDIKFYMKTIRKSNQKDNKFAKIA